MIINYSGTISTVETFASTDTVSFTGNTTVTGSITKTDTLAQTILMATGISVTVSSGFLDISGSRGADADSGPNIVWFDSAASAGSKKLGDWNFFAFTGSNASNKMTWVGFANAIFGCIFQGHAPAQGQFRYLFYYNINAGFFITGSTAGLHIEDVYSIKVSAILVQNTAGQILDRFTFVDDSHGSNDSMLANFMRTATINDWYYERNESGQMFRSFVVGNILTARRFYTMINAELNNAINPTGTLNFVDSIFNKGAIPVFATSGIVNITDSDILEGGADFVGAFESGGGELNLTSVALFANNKADIDNFDTDTAQPSTSIPAQYLITNGSITTPRSSRRFPLDFSNIVTVSGTDNGITINCDTGIPARVRILLGTTSGTYDKGATDWDAPDVRIERLKRSLTPYVSDIGESGKKFKLTGHSIVLDNLKDDETYFFIIEAESITGEKYFSVEGSFTIVEIDPSDIVPPVWDTTTGIQTLEVTNANSLKATWNGATDSDSPPVLFNIYIREGSAPNVFGTDSVFYFGSTDNLQAIIDRDPNDTDAENPIGRALKSGIEYFVIIKASDKQGNEDVNTTALSETTRIESFPVINMQNIIRTRFRNQIENVFANLSGRVQYDNAPLIVKPNAIHVRLAIRPVSSNQVAFGKVKRTRNTGSMVASIFNPTGKGGKEMNDLADLIHAEFGKITIQGVVFKAPTNLLVGREGKEWQLDVSVPYHGDSLK